MCKGSERWGEFRCTLLDDPCLYPIRPWSLLWSAPDHLPVQVFCGEGGWVFKIREGYGVKQYCTLRCIVLGVKSGIKSLQVFCEGDGSFITGDVGFEF